MINLNRGKLISPFVSFGKVEKLADYDAMLPFSGVLRGGTNIYKKKGDLCRSSFSEEVTKMHYPLGLFAFRL